MPARLGRWPQLRAAFVVFHVCAVLVLSLPTSDKLGSPAAWKTATSQADLEAWSARLREGAHAYGAFADEVRYELGALR